MAHKTNRPLTSMEFSVPLKEQGLVFSLSFRRFFDDGLV